MRLFQPTWCHMVFLVTLLLSLLIIVGFTLVLLLTRQSRRYMQRADVIQLFEWVLLGQARESNWRVFCDIPLHHDAQLEAIRLQCIALEEAHFLGEDHPYLFTRDGLKAIRHLLDSLRTDS